MTAVVVLGTLALLITYGSILDFYAGNPPDRYLALLLLDVCLGVAAIALYPLRHRAPLAVVSGIVVLSAFSTLATGASVLGIISLAARRQARELLVIAPVFLLAITVAELVIQDPDPLPWWQLIVGAVMMLGVLILIGMYIGNRRQLQTTLEQKLLSERREHAAVLEAARETERTQIAREMHDVLAHRLSLVAVHSGALESRTDLSPEETAQTAGIIRANAHRALTELREVLGVLRTQPVADWRTTPPRPQPTMAGLDDLLNENRTAGSATTLQVAQTVSAALDTLSESTSRHLFRIIQEGLTNARKHAPGQAVSVLLGGTVGEIVIVAVSNPVDSQQVRTEYPSSGVGLTGMRERVRLAGGQMSAGHEATGQFLMKAELPWTLQ